MQVEQYPPSSRRRRGASKAVAGVGIDSGAATAAERESRFGEGHDRKISRSQEGEEEKADDEDEGGDVDGDEEGEEESGDKEGEEEGEGEREDGDEDGEEEDDDEQEGEEEDDDDDDEYDERVVSSSEQDEDEEDAWEDVAYQSLARNLNRRRRRYLLSRSSQVLRGNLQKLGGII